MGRSQKKTFSALRFGLKIRGASSPGSASASYLASFHNCSMITSFYIITRRARWVAAAQSSARRFYATITIFCFYLIVQFKVFLLRESLQTSFKVP